MAAASTSSMRDGRERTEPWRRLWRLHVADVDPGSDSLAPVSSLTPALLAPYADPSRVRTDEPLLVRDEPGPEDPLCEPFGRQLQALVERIDAPRAGRDVLRDNLGRLERCVRTAFAEAGRRPCPVREVFERAAAAMRDELALRGEAAASLEAALQALAAALPVGELLAVDGDATLLLLAAVARARAASARAARRRELARLRDALAERLEAERARDPARRTAEHLARQMGAGAALLDPARLASSLPPARGTRPLEPALRERLERVVELLDAELGRTHEEALVVVHGADLVAEAHLAELVRAGCRPVAAADPCEAAAREFDERIAERLAVARAERLARAFLDGHAPLDRLEAWLDRLDWRALDARELEALAPIAAVDSARALAHERLGSLCALLVSGRPVQVVGLVALGEEATEPETREGHRLDLAYLAIAHREAFVQQSTPARAAHLVEGFERALDSGRAGLHVVASGLDAGHAEPAIGAWLHASAAIEARAHPLLRYDPSAGETWARRLDVAGNPALEEDWPRGEPELEGWSGGELAFTYADYALLEPQWRDELRVLPPDEEEAAPEDLVSVDELLERGQDSRHPRVPFVWAVDAEGRPRRVVVGRRLLRACEDRRRFWRTLRELAGVRNEYVEEAERRVREEEQAKARAEREELEARHAAELEEVRRRAAGEAMEGLARALLAMDGTVLPAGEVGGAPRAEAVAEPAAVEPAGEPEPQAAEPPPSREEGADAAKDDEDAAFEEPWIDSALCTSCNDCIQLNPKLFGYDENKQARILDPRAGTYAQLVQAAEKCPARCIHPGLPWNPDEPNLEELKRRAAPFNR